MSEPQDADLDPAAVEQQVVEYGANGEDRAPDRTPSEDRHQANMAFLRDALNPVYQVLKSCQPQTNLIVDENGEPDIEFRGTRLYGPKGLSVHNESQWDVFWGNPRRADTGIIDARSLDTHARNFGAELIEKLEADGVEPDPKKAGKQCYHAISFGIGLAAHLPRLVEETRCANLLLIEPNPEFLYHSTYVFDWKAFFETYSDRTTIRLAFSDTVQQMVTGAQALIRNTNPACLDGSVFFVHYPNVKFQSALDELYKEKLSVAMMGLGFFEDELHMISNTYENLRHGSSRVFDFLDEPVDLPAIVIGNGPSLDGLIPVLKACRDDVALLCCGSALEPLLANGLIPDFLLMLERGGGLLTDQRVAAEQASLRKICFIGAANVYPGVTEFHDVSILGFRGGLSTKPLFARRPNQSPPHFDPLVANAATSFACHAGFREVYLFGVDCGAKDPDYHHSKQSQYTTRNIKYNFSFNIPQPGNFGGQVLTTSVLNWSKDVMEKTFKAFAVGRRFFNCSDGIRINGVLPRHPSTLKFKKFKGKKKVIQKLIERFPYYSKDDFQAAWSEARIYERLDEMAEALIDLVATNDLIDFKYLQQIMTHLRPATGDDPVSMIYRGTVYHMLMVIYTISRRIEDPDQQLRFQENVQQVFAKHIRDMRDEAIEQFRTVEAGEWDWDANVPVPPTYDEEDAGSPVTPDAIA